MATRSITTYGAAFTLQVSVPDSDLLIISLLKVTHNPSSAFTLYVVSLRPEVDVTGKGSQKGAICDGRRRKCKSSFCFLQHIETQAKHRALKVEEIKKEKTRALVESRVSAVGVHPSRRHSPLSLSRRWTPRVDGGISDLCAYTPDGNARIRFLSDLFP